MAARAVEVSDGFDELDAVQLVVIVLIVHFEVVKLQLLGCHVLLVD